MPLSFVHAGISEAWLNLSPFRMIGMTPSQCRWIVAVGITIVSLAACRSANRAPVRASADAGGRTEGNLAAVGKARADSIRRPYTAADIHFMSAMIGHHSQAIVMAGWAPTHGASASVLRLAERIVNGQQDEIVTMQQWLGDRNQPVPNADARGVTMMMNGAEHVMLMPGMLTEIQLRELDEARGPKFDRLFLTFMIQHHRGAVSMVTDLFGSYGAGQDEIVFKFASDVNVDQSTETARMELMLASIMPALPSP